MANAVRINKTQRRKINVFVRCVGISLLAWLLFSISNQYTVSVKAAIEYVNLPEKRAFHPQQSDTVKVKLEMTGWQFLFSKAALETPKVQVDLSSLKTKDWIVFSNQLGFINRQFPHEQRVVSVSPDTLFFDFSKQTQRKVPVKPLANIGFKRGYGVIADTKVTPAYVTITGPYEDVSAIEYWETDTVRGKEVGTDVRTVANLARNQKANINVYPTSVEVLMPVGELTEKVIELPVKVENGQRYSSVRLSPSKVVVTVLMSVKDYNNYTSRDFEAVVDLADWEKNEVQYLPILLTKVPDYCKVISIVPQNVDFLYVNNDILMKIGITGGIGSGKTFICQLFKALAVPVYNADDEAKKLMNTDLRIRESLIAAFGEATYKDGILDRAFLAQQIFSDKAKLELVNGIVHPIVIQAAKDWAEQQKARYSLKEAALLFESGSYKDLDYTILVTAPLSVRVQRVMERDGVTEAQVLERISKQLTDEEK